MPIHKTEFPGLMVIEPIVFEDARGYFFESFNQKVFEAEGLRYNWVQDNQSKSSYGVIRGLHYQLNPHSQAKLVRVFSGSVLDVAVDLRKGSPVYGKCFCIELSDQNRLQLLIPRGFAHGFSVLTPTAEVFYKCDQLYSKAAEASIIYNDPVLKIDWKIPANDIILSEKDTIHPTFAESRHNFEFEG